MMRFIARRLIWSVFVIFAVITLVFGLMYWLGSPAAATIPNADPQQIADFNRKYGLDQPIWKQYASYLGVIPCTRPNSPKWNADPAKNQYCGLFQGDLGESYGHQEPVADVIAHRLPRTILLSTMALGFELFLGLAIGVIAAMRRHTWGDTGLMGLAFLGISLPTFVTGPIALEYVAFRLGWFPVGGYGVDFNDHVWHAILPAAVLAIIGAATYARVMRDEMLNTLNLDFVRTAHAKGLSPMRVLFAHVMRNALLPIVTLMGLSMAFLVSGAIITEQIFAWPGMGSLAIEAINNMDAPTVMAVVLMFSFMVQLGNLLADLAVGALDPRVRIEITQA